VARVFIDTNVLFPFSVMDLMLALTEDAVHEVVWTDALLDEWERVIVEQQRRSAESAARITAAIRDFLRTARSRRSATLIWSTTCLARITTTGTTLRRLSPATPS
jgi:hypothetical protein